MQKEMAVGHQIVFRLIYTLVHYGSGPPMSRPVGSRIFESAARFGVNRRKLVKPLPSDALRKPECVCGPSRDAAHKITGCGNLNKWFSNQARGNV
jgi:hypothetical protein